jgi:cytochrome c5
VFRRRQDIQARIKPVGELGKPVKLVVRAAASSGGAARSGDAVYNQFCFVCHGTGVGGAPKFTMSEWAPHLAKATTSLTSVTKGLNAMPPKGTYELQDDELYAASRSCRRLSSRRFQLAERERLSDVLITGSPARSARVREFEDAVYAARRQTESIHRTPDQRAPTPSSAQC